MVGYYQIESIRSFADEIGRLKTAWGILFSASGGFIAGGIVPEIAKFLTGKMQPPGKEWVSSTIFNGFVYAVVATQVDYFYRFQSFAFGDGIDPGTLALKTVVDMGLFSPFLCMPTAVLLCEWRIQRWRLGPTVRSVTRLWYRDRVIPTLIPGWAFWIPFLLCLYALPAALQLPFAFLGEAAWSIIFIFIATQSDLEPEGA